MLRNLSHLSLKSCCGNTSPHSLGFDDSWGCTPKKVGVLLVAETSVTCGGLVHSAGLAETEQRSNSLKYLLAV